MAIRRSSSLTCWLDAWPCITSGEGPLGSGGRYGPPIRDDNDDDDDDGNDENGGAYGGGGMDGSGSDGGGPACADRGEK